MTNENQKPKADEVLGIESPIKEHFTKVEESFLRIFDEVQGLQKYVNDKLQSYPGGDSIDPNTFYSGNFAYFWKTVPERLDILSDVIIDIRKNLADIIETPTDK